MSVLDYMNTSAVIESVGLFNMRRVNLNLFLACIIVHNDRVGDPKVDIMWQGYPTPTFSVYRKDNLNIPIYPHCLTVT